MRIFRYVYLVFVLTIFSCVPNQEDENKELEGFFQKNEDATQALYYRFPSASEMFSYLHSNELQFKQNIVNPIEQLNNYQTTEAKLLNLGVYLADLSYLVVFQERQLAQHYLTTVQRLTSQLRIEP